MERIKKLLGQGVKIIMLLVVGGLSGIWINLEYQKYLEEKIEKVQIIAVVNMDEGVSVNGEQINYAGQLIQFPSDNFVITGLNEAKLGIENGVYAAYIVIAADFSEAVLSIQDNPEKIILEYAINSKLDEEVEKQVIDDINAFEITLNTNVAYMYVDAILAAFHNVQDDSIVILQNDSNELLTLQNVDGEKLVEWMEKQELTNVPNEIGQVNLNTYLESNESTLNAMQQEYNTSIQTGVAEFADVKTGHINVSNAINDFFTLYQTTLDESERKNTEVLEAGGNNIEIALDVFNQSLPTDYSVMHNGISQLVENQRSADEISGNTQMKEILQRMITTAYKQGANDVIQDAEANIVETRYSANELRDIYEEISNEIDTNAEQYTRNAITDQTKITLNTIEEAGSEKITDMLEEFSALFEMVDERQTVADTIQTELIDKLAEAQRGQMDNLVEEGDKLQDTMENYETELERYDPFKYLNATSMSGYLTDISQNTQTMFREVQANNREHLNYASEVYITAQQDLNEMDMAYRSASEQTAANVEECVDNLQSSREEINSQNTEMLLNFTTLLEYTREGSQENVEVYGHIVDPVVPLESGTSLINDANQEVKSGITLKSLFVVLLIVSFMLILSSCVSFIQNRPEKAVKEKTQ